MIPIASTTVTIYAPGAGDLDPLSDGYAEPDVGTADPVARATGVRAVISVGGAGGTSSSGVGGELAVVVHQMVCDPTTVDYRDTVLDEVTGQRFTVEWVVATPGIGNLDHIQAGLRSAEGGRT